MYLKVRVSSNTKSQFEAYKWRKYGKDCTYRIGLGYLLGLAVEEESVQNAEKYDFEQYKEKAAKEEEKLSTTLTIRQETNQRLKELQSKFGAANPASVIAFIMSVAVHVDPQPCVIENDTDLAPKKTLYQKTLYHYLPEVNKKPDYENLPESKNCIKKIGDGAFRDIICPFFPVYLSFLAIAEGERSRPLFRFDNGVQIDAAAKNSASKYVFVDKQIHSREVLRILDGDFANRTDDKRRLYSAANNSKLIERLIRAVYCLGNVTDIPDSDFNGAKGVLAFDFLPLFVDLIEDCLRVRQPLEYKETVIKVETLKEWKNWLINNRESRFLTEYYYTKETKDGQLQLVGIPLFPAQSLKNPLPRTADELEECVRSIERIVHTRSLLLSER